MPKDHPPIPEEMPNPGKIPEVQEPEVPEAPETPDEPPLVIPSEDPMPEIPDEMPSTDGGGFVG